jgi:hypothetical protein
MTTLSLIALGDLLTHCHNIQGVMHNPLRAIAL